MLGCRVLCLAPKSLLQCFWACFFRSLPAWNGVETCVRYRGDVSASRAIVGIFISLLPFTMIFIPTIALTAPSMHDCTAAERAVGPRLRVRPTRTIFFASGGIMCSINKGRVAQRCVLVKELEPD